jgi:hypothetical protein
MPSVSLPIEYSLGCILFGIFNAPAFCTKYLHFLAHIYHAILIRQLANKNTLDYMDAGFGRRKP